jgi:acyl-CoA thioesterase I
MTDRRVLFFGDSFVAGAGDPRCQGWVGRVCAAAWDAGLAVTPYNLGVRGQTSVDVAARFSAEAAVRLLPGVASTVVVSVGANDCVGSSIEGEPRVVPATSVSAVGSMLDAASALRLPAFVVGPPPVGSADADGRIVALTERFAEVCAERAVPFVPVASALLADGVWCAEAAVGDGAHPGAGGYDALAALVLSGGWLAWLTG